MWDYIVGIFCSYPQIAIFLTIAVGYYVGTIKFFKFNLGSTTGVLLVALLIGQMKIEIHPLLKTVGFALFIFTIGYKVGPQFFHSLGKKGISYLGISIVVALTGLGMVIFLGKILGLDEGFAAGLLGGAMTQSAILGTADEAIKHLSISASQKTILQSNMAAAYAITYIFGTAGFILFVRLIPKILKINLGEEAKKLEEQMSGALTDEKSPELFSWYKKLNLRAYKVENKEIATKTVDELEKMFDKNVIVEKIKRANNLIKPQSDTTVQIGDEIALVGDRRKFFNADRIIGSEIDDREMIDIMGEILSVCILKSGAIGKTLGQISEKYGYGCFLRKITRQGQELPLAKDIVIHKCDVLQITGAKKDVERMVKALGYPERYTMTTDMIMVGLGCVLGTLLGLVAVPVFGLPLGLGIGGGVLISGLIFGWLRSLHPTFGQIPNGTQWIFTNLGLNLFIACVGLTAGPRVVHAIQITGVSLAWAGAIVTITPLIIGLLFGRLVIKMNNVLLFGALTGAGTCTAALNSLKEQSRSAMPVLGYTIGYAFGNIFLTIWGTVIVHVM